MKNRINGLGPAFFGALMLVSSSAYAQITYTPSTTGVGTPVIVTSSVTSSGIPNNVQTAPITTAARGRFKIDDITTTCDGTGWVNPAFIAFTLNNTIGQWQTVADSIYAAAAIASFVPKSYYSMSAAGMNMTYLGTIESGSRLFVSGSNKVGTGVGVCVVDVYLTRLTDGASIGAVNVP